MRIKKNSLGIAFFFIVLLSFTAYTIATPFSETNFNILEKKDNLLANQDLSIIIQNGQPETINGFLETTFKENFETNEFILEYHLQTDNSRYRVHFDGEAQIPESGSEITLQGFVFEDSIAVTDFEVSEDDSLRGLTPLSKIGEQRLLLIMVNFQNNPQTPITPEEARYEVFNEDNPHSLASWFRTVSYGKTWLTGDVINWITINLTAAQACDIAAMRSAVLPGVDQYIDFRNYDRIMFVFPIDYSCGYAGIGTFGSARIVGLNDGPVYLSFTLINGVNNLDDGTGAHELGHNLALLHAADLECGSQVISDTGCSASTYGDEFDVMGTTYNKGYFNAYHMQTAQWLDSTNIQEVQEGTSGTYVLEPLENPSDGLKAVKFTRGSNKWIYVEYRRPISYDSIAYDFIGPGVYNGAIIHSNEFSTMAPTADTYLLDNSPHTNSEISQVFDSDFTALGVGQTFTDPASGATVTVTAMSEESLTIQVNMPVLCGNGILNAGEQCDGSIFAAGSCTNLSAIGSNGILVFYDGGNLICNSSCRIDSTQCTIHERCPWDQNRDEVVTPGDRGLVSTQIGCAVGTGNPLCDLADLSGDGRVTAADRGFIGANLGFCPE